MPNNFFSVDSRFPNIENKTQEQINGEVINYLFLLLEQLRYTLGNLGVGNFNEAELDGIAGMISDPIYVRLEDAEGNINAVQITAEGLTEQLTNVKGDVNTLTITAEGLTEQLTNVEGDVNTLSITAEGLTEQLTNVEGNVNTLSITAEGLTEQLTNVEGDVNTLSIKAEGLTEQLTNVEGDVNTLSITAEGLTEQLTNVEGDVNTLQITAEGLRESITNAENHITQVDLKAEGIITRVEGPDGSIAQLTQRSNKIEAEVGNTNLRIDGLGVEIAGKVSFTNLQTPGATKIDAGNITTGTLSAVNIDGCLISTTDAAGRLLLIGNGAFTIYSGYSMIGGMYINDANEMLVLHAARGLQLDASVKIAGESTINGYLILHMGNIAQNAASIRALLGI